MRVGALTVDPVYDGYGDQVARDILHVPGQPDAWDKCGHYVDDAGNIQLICGGYLLRAGDRVVLIDAGLGEYEDEQWHGGQFLDSLRGLGVTPAEVTDVVFTHLHWDHFGWATRKGEIVFGDSPDVIGAAHFPFGHVITVDGGHQFRFLE
jgi:glyoxylase-like metal-dependent hydrolase (beta-lactamase superfamily II)